MLKSGVNTSLSLGQATDIVEVRFDSDQVRNAVLWWSPHLSKLDSVELMDKSGRYILKAGHCEMHEKSKKHEVELCEDERIVGIASYTNDFAVHYDF